MRKYKRLTFTQRLQIEALLKAKLRIREIAEIVNVHISTVYREVKRGQYEAITSELIKEVRYSPDIAHSRYREQLSVKGASLKIANDIKLANYIEHRIAQERYSPEAVIAELNRIEEYPFKVKIQSHNTIYSYIDKGVFMHLTNEHLPVRTDKKRTCRKIKPARPPRGTSIELRPNEVAERASFGDWEMDTVQGVKKSKARLLVLSERYTRKEIILPMPDNTTKSVVRALDGLERKYGKLFGKIFKSITVDNGVEFSDAQGIESSVFRKGKRTRLYYCHPYSSWERGTNENINKLIRRHFPKGTNFSKIKRSEIKYVEDWINNYPRRILGFSTASLLFEHELSNIM